MISKNLKNEEATARDGAASPIKKIHNKGVLKINKIFCTDTIVPILAANELKKQIQKYHKRETQLHTPT